MGLHHAVRFALRLLITAAEFDSATGGVDPAGGNFATLRVLRPQGIETIDEAAQIEFLKSEPPPAANPP
jgi:hypothetical protein